MILKYLILMLLVLSVLLIGCDESEKTDIEKYWEDQGYHVYAEQENFIDFCLENSSSIGSSCEIEVYALCKDKIVCYTFPNMNEVECLRDKDLVNKYCNITRIKNE